MGSQSQRGNWLKCFLTLPRKLRRIVNLKDDVLYGSKRRIITFQPSQTWVNWCFNWAGNNVPQNQKLWLYGEAGNCNSNSDSEQLRLKPCVFPSWTKQHFFLTTVTNSFYFQLSLIITIISLHNTTCVITPLNSTLLGHNGKTSKQHSYTETSTLPVSLLSSVVLCFLALVGRKQEKEKGYLPPQSKSCWWESNMNILYSF